MIRQKKKICIKCGNETYIFSKGRCRSCTPNKSIKKSYNHIKKISEKGKIKKEAKTIRTKEIHQSMYNWWLKQEKNQCMSCGCKLPNEFHTWMVDHKIMKSKHPELALEEENFFLCCLSCHSSKENGFPSVIHKKAIDETKLKFNIP